MSVVEAFCQPLTLPFVLPFLCVVWQPRSPCTPSFLLFITVLFGWRCAVVPKTLQVDAITANAYFMYFIFNSMSMGMGRGKGGKCIALCIAKPVCSGFLDSKPSTVKTVGRKQCVRRGSCQNWFPSKEIAKKNVFSLFCGSMFAQNVFLWGQIAKEIFQFLGAKNKYLAKGATAKLFLHSPHANFQTSLNLRSRGREGMDGWMDGTRIRGAAPWDTGQKL